MAVEYVVVSLTGRTSPYVSERVSQLLHVVEITKEDLVVDGSSEVPRLEEVDGVQIGDVNSARVG